MIQSIVNLWIPKAAGSISIRIMRGAVGLLAEVLVFKRVGVCNMGVAPRVEVIELMCGVEVSIYE